jgi:hypothetical protein
MPLARAKSAAVDDKVSHMGTFTSSLAVFKAAAEDRVGRLTSDNGTIDERVGEGGVRGCVSQG